MARRTLVIDLNRCSGCDSCTVACKYENNIKLGSFWNRVMAIGPTGAYPDIEMYWMPMQCQQCESSPCVSVCPTGATYKDDKGRVEIHYDKCIGCRICMAACPYNARVFNWNEPERDPNWNYGDKDVPVRPKGVAEKCTLCKERTDRGDIPMCVRVCPGRARVYGDLDDPDSEISKVVRENKAYQLLEEFGTRPQLRYYNA